MKHYPAIALVLFGAACDDELAQPHADLLLPTVVPVEWEDAYNAEQDGLGALVPVDVMVYDGATGEPIEDVEVLVTSTDPGAVPIPTEGILVVGGPIDEVPAADEEGADAVLEDPLPVEDDLAWDATRDQYILLLEPEDTGEDWEDLGLALQTDPTGLARLYLYVDAFPALDAAADRRSFSDITVVVTVVDPAAPDHLREGSFLLVPR